MRLQIEAREKMQAELNKQEEQKKLEAKQAEQMALAAAKAVESLFAIPICHTCQSNRNALGLVTERKRNGMSEIGNSSITQIYCNQTIIVPSNKNICRLQACQ
jgi:hypothetical protein